MRDSSLNDSGVEISSRHIKLKVAVLRNTKKNIVKLLLTIYFRSPYDVTTVIRTQTLFSWPYFLKSIFWPV